MNDIYEHIFQQKLVEIGYIAGNIMLTVDGGPDYSVGSWLNLYYYGLLWQESKLDQLFVVSYTLIIQSSLDNIYLYIKCY